MSSLSERAILTTLSVSQWTARKFDSGETSHVNRRHGLAIQAARVNKSLLPHAVELNALQQTTSMIRKDFDRYTLPWGIDGMRILKSDTYLQFSQEVNHWRDQWETARDAFLKAYPRLKRAAQAGLGALYIESDYPKGRDLDRLFRFDVQFMPIADERDWRIDVGDEARATLERDIKARLIKVEQAAMTEAWSRIHEVVEKTVEKLAAPSAVFRNSLIDNAVDLCGLMPSLNLANDPEMERARQTIERTLAKFVGNVDALRHDPVEREAAVKALNAVMRKMSGYIPKKAA